MSIKTKLLILTAFSLTIIVAMGFMLSQNVIAVRMEIEKQEIMSEVHNKLFERVALRDEYLLYREQRPLVQLKLTSVALEQLFILASKVDISADEQMSVRRLRDNNAFLDQALSQVIANAQSQDSSSSADAKAMADKSANVNEVEQGLVNQIFIKFQESVTIASRLLEASRSRIVESQQKATLFVLLSIAVIALVVIVVLYFIWLSIGEPLASLTEIAVRVAALDFTTTTTTTGPSSSSNDEIGALSRSFNTMSTKLKEYYGKLEQKVRDRTQDLEKANIATKNVLEDLRVEKEKLDVRVKESETLNRAMVGRELKMIELKKEIERLKKQAKGTGGEN